MMPVKMKKVKIIEWGAFEITASTYSDDICLKCEKEGIPVITIQFNYHSIKICFVCLEKAKVELENV